MMAAARHRYGDSSAVSVEQLPRPTITADEVLIEVRAAGLDRGTEHLLNGKPWLLRLFGFGLRRPKQPILGLDVAGTVVAVGPKVTRFAVGDEVMGIAKGSFAQFAAAVETKLVHKPVNLSFEQAAVSTVSGVTALQALTDVGHLQSGQRVLVIGASGGVGTFAVQLATAMGARVDGIAGADNLDLVRSLGADRAIDYRATDLDDLAAETEPYDLVLDIGGRNPVRTLRRLLSPEGTLVFVGGENGGSLTGGMGRTLWALARSVFWSQRMAMFVASEHYAMLERLAEYLGDGSVVPVIAETYSLDDTTTALRRMESGRSGGKTVIRVPPAA
jgi:NADPH:quinone reductase-like Zn-dependent oxidoreductase